LAHDRLVLFVKVSRELNFPARAQKLGGASDVELRKLARLEYRRALGQVRYEGVGRQAEGFRTGGFSARATLYGRTVPVGIWPTEREAAIARDRAMLAAGADPLELNFPREAQKLGGASVTELRRLARFRYQRLVGASSQFWGVYRDSSGKLWKATARVDDQHVDLGTYRTEKQAALIRDRVEVWLRGKSARINFPEELGRPLSPQRARYLAEKQLEAKTASAKPTRKASAKPTRKASAKPTRKASAKPTRKASAKPTRKASAKPTRKATAKPTRKATAKPTRKASAKPTRKASAKPTRKASAKPTRKAVRRLTKRRLRKRKA
jgi:hypothetical protein